MDFGELEIRLVSKVIELEKKIVEASLRYYKGEQLTMTDDQFDSAIDELRNLYPTHWILKTTGWGANDSDSKIKHIGARPVGSLNKVKYPDSVPSLKHKGIITPKLDGLTVVTNVYNGHINALTRNDGIVGKDCTNKIVHILQTKHPKFYESLLKIEGMFSFRGEIVTDPSSHDYIKANLGISLRNIAAGMINRNEVTSDLDHLLYVPYFIRIDSLNRYDNNKEMIDKLESMGAFPIPHEEFDTVEPEYLSRVYSDWKVGFLIDGLVISNYEGWVKGSDYTENESHSIAYKFEAESKEAIVDKIVWDTGSAGRVVPVAVLTAPIELSGAMVQNISCHHAKNVLDNLIGKGAVVRVSRANEVIPYINEVVSPATIDVKASMPAKCPVCNSEVQWDGCYLICPSVECPAQARTLIFRFFDCCSIPEGLSVTTITKWLDEFPVAGGFSRIESIIDFITLFKQVPHHNTASRAIQLQEKFNNHYGDLLYKFENNIQAKLDAGVTYGEFWYTLNLKGLGSSSSKKISHIDPCELKKEDIDTTLKDIAGITYLVAESLKSTFDRWKHLCRLLNIIPEQEKKLSSNKYSNIVFCVTGVRDKVLSLQLTSNGATEIGGVGKGCNLLIAKDPSSSSGKASQARSQGIEIISLEEALRRFM